MCRRFTLANADLSDVPRLFRQVEPPPYNLFPSDKAEEVFMKLGRAKIHGRAILHFDPIPDAPET